MFTPSEVPLIVLGCFHEAQIEVVGSKYENAQRQFRQLLESLIAKNGIRFIGEEAKQTRISIAEQLAKVRQIRYRNIDIPIGCQEQIKHVPSSVIDEETMTIKNTLNTGDKYAQAWNLVREYHMHKTALDGLHEAAEPSLLVVGELHVEPLIAIGFPVWFRVQKKLFPSV